MTVQEYLYGSRALIDDYNTGGAINSPTDPDMQELQLNGIQFFNMAVNQVYKNIRVYEEFEIVSKKIPNLLDSNFNIVEFIGEDQFYPNDGIEGAKAYFFTIDDDATVLIQEYNGSTWNTLETKVLTPTGKTDFSGLITATDPGYPIRLVFSGTTFYRHLNRCLYSYPFKADSIPEYKACIPHEMPDDFGQLVEIVREYPYSQYALDGFFKWEGRKTLLLDYNYEGTTRIIYNPIFVPVTSLDQEVNIFNPDAQEFIKFFVAAKMATTENPDLVNFFESKADELRFEALKGQPASEEKIADVFLNQGYTKGGYYYG